MRARAKRRIAAARRARLRRGASARRATGSNARRPKRASATRSFAARRKPISSVSRKTRREGAFPAANQPRLLQSPARPRSRPALARAGGEEDEARRVPRRPALALPGQKVVVPTPRPARSGEQRNRGRLTVASATSGEEERTRSVASFRRRTQRLKSHGLQDQKEKIAREIVLPEAITIQELAG